MPNKHLDAGLELALIPSLPILGRRLGGEHGRLNTGFAQNRFKPARHVALLGVGGEDLDTPPALRLRLD
jgi:hypothetical protein